MCKQYNKRVTWTIEEEDLLLEAMKDTKRVNIDKLREETDLFDDKTNKHISNKIASLKNKPTKYKKREKWTIEQEKLLLKIIVESKCKISYKDLKSDDVLKDKEYCTLKNKIYSMKMKMNKARDNNI